MNIRLTPEQEKIVEAELQSGHFRTAGEVIEEALQALHKKGRASDAVASHNFRREAVSAILTFVEKNRTRLEGISVKDLIHQGHRL
jgi:Arc/MetJ-type ribon-helix-helix transcriptional regulator